MLSLSWYLSGKRHTNRSDNTEFDLFIERIYELLKMRK